MQFPTKLTAPSVQPRFYPDWEFALVETGQLAAGAGPYAVYSNTNARRQGMPKESVTYIALAGWLYGPYFRGHVTVKKQQEWRDDLKDMLDELNVMLKQGETVRSLPGVKVERCRLEEMERS